MKGVIYLVLLIAVVFQLVGCDACLGIGCTENFNFRIVRKISGEDLVFSQNPIYKKDSVFLFSELYAYLVPMSLSDNTKFSSTNGAPVDTLYLRLNSIDIDTLLLNYNLVKIKCCKEYGGYGKITGINFNGIMAKKQGDVFLFEK